MVNPRVPLYERLPEVYRIRDAEQFPPYQLQHYLRLVENVFADVHENIESLYHDLFIETCDDWVIPYIGDLLGTSPLKGDPHTLRADVADTIALRRRKGTLGAIERLIYDLTRWGVHCVELRENLVWNQSLNHQRPDAGGQPPYGLPTVNRFTPIRGGTLPLRDPAQLSLLNSPFDPFAHTADLKPPALGQIRYNLSNLAIFLWRLAVYRIAVSQPVIRAVIDRSATAVAPEAAFVVRLEVHPLGQPLRLFNTSRFDPERQPPVISDLDATAGPIPTPRLSASGSAPEQYISIETYDPASLADPSLPLLERLDISEVGLQLHLPEASFAGQTWPQPGTPQVWTIRGENLCAWETGLGRSLKHREVAVDPVIGRIAIAVETAAQAQALSDHLLLTYSYGAVGAVGAHPISRTPAPQSWQGETLERREVNFHQNPNGLRDALNSLENSPLPIVIEIADSMTHVLDLGAVVGMLIEDGGPTLRLSRSLIIRAASNQRPVILLSHPLRFRPSQIVGSNPLEQAQFDAVIANLTVRLEGIYLSRDSSFPAGEPLIARAALNRLELLDCTLDPGGILQLNATRSPIQPGLRLRNQYGFLAGSAAEREFKQTPELHLHRSIAGPLWLDTGYSLFLSETILDAGKGVGDDPGSSFAVANAADPINGWGPVTQVNGLTVFGRMRVEQIQGRGGIWLHVLEVLNNQKGCIKFSYFRGEEDSGGSKLHDRLPQHHACVTGATLRFVSEIFGQPAYGQLHASSDFRIRERGPNDDAMGAFGFLLEAHKWRNIQIRYREFMPVGVRPLLIPVT